MTQAPVHDVESFEDERWRSFSQPQEFRHAAALALITEGPTLDIGCGDGLLLGLLKERGIAAQGADISGEAVRQCMARGLVAHVYDPVRPLPYADGSFETVVLLDVLEHVYEPESLLREAARVAHTDVIVGVPNFSSLPARMQVMRGLVPENNQPNKGHVYWFNKRVLDRVARDAGLTEVELRMNTFRPFTSLPQWLVRVFPNALALSFVGKYRVAAR